MKHLAYQIIGLATVVYFFDAIGAILAALLVVSWSCGAVLLAMPLFARRPKPTARRRHNTELAERLLLTHSRD